MEFTPAAYLHFADSFKNILLIILDTRPYYMKDLMLPKKSIVENSYSTSEVGLNKPQLYRVNMYNSTQRVEINGKSYVMFVEELSQIGSKMSNNADYTAINSKIRKYCEDFIVKNKNSSVSNPAIGCTIEKPTHKNPPCQNYCPKCKRQCATKYVQCLKGDHRVHFHCERLTKEEIDTILQHPDRPYTCSIHADPTTLQQINTLAIQDQPANNKKSDPGVSTPNNSDDITQNNVTSQSLSNKGFTVNSSAEDLLLEEMSVTCTVRDGINDGDKSGPPEIRTNLSKHQDEYKSKTQPVTSLKEKELRQKEIRLKKWEEELKQQNANINQTTAEISKLQAHILKLEAKIQELENSNRILRIKVAGSIDCDRQTPYSGSQSQNQSINSHIVTHGAYDTAWQLEHQNLEIIKGRLNNIEEFNILHRKIQELENNTLKQRIDQIERQKVVGLHDYMYNRHHGIQTSLQHPQSNVMHNPRNIPAFPPQFNVPPPSYIYLNQDLQHQLSRHGNKTNVENFVTGNPISFQSMLLRSGNPTYSGMSGKFHSKPPEYQRQNTNTTRIILNGMSDNQHSTPSFESHDHPHPFLHKIQLSYNPSNNLGISSVSSDQSTLYNMSENQHSIPTSYTTNNSQISGQHDMSGNSHSTPTQTLLGTTNKQHCQINPYQPTIKIVTAMV